MAALAVTMTSASAVAADLYPDYSYFEDFSEMGNQGDALPSEWVTYGIGEVPVSEWQEVFGTTGEGPYYRLMYINNTWGAFSNSSYVEDVESDEWLVTPSIKIKTNDEVLLFTVTGYGAAKCNNFMAFLSETGNTKDDFTKAPIAVSSIFGSSYDVKTRQVAVRLQGYAGKNVYLAFVNRSKDSALLGINEIYIAPYCVKVKNNTPAVLPAGSDATVSVTADIRTPYEIDGVKAVLTTPNGQKQEIEFNQKISLYGTTLNVTFPKPINIGESGINYTISFTPNMENVEPMEISGAISTPQRTYTPVAVVEELTGSWCGNCPRGAAYLDYFSDKYNSDAGRVYGIAVHGQDLMTIEDGQYLSTLIAESDSQGYPHAFFQRTYGSDPASPEIVEELMDTPSYSAINIDHVDFEGSVGDKLHVKFNVENAYDKTNLNQKVAFVLVEDKVTSTDADYYQANSYSGISEAAIVKTYGQELWPYFKKYCEGAAIIVASKMVYNHVARGIYPNYFGLALNGSCSALEKVNFEYEFECPSNVMKPENIAVIALLLDSDTDRIITADKMEAADFNKVTKVDGIVENDIEIKNEGGKLMVVAPSAVSVEVFGIDGTLLEKIDSENGLVDMYAADRFSGVVIVKATTATGMATEKILF